MTTKAEELALATIGKGCLGHSQDDEPVFILVGRDRLAADIVREWADRLEHRAVMLAEYTAERQGKVAEARGLAIRMDEWRRNHGGGKLPD